MTLRLNARVDAELARKLEYIRERSGGSTTDVVKASLEAYYAKLVQAESPASSLKDFIGCVRGSADLSRDYKATLTDSLAIKHASSQASVARVNKARQTLPLRPKLSKSKKARP